MNNDSEVAPAAGADPDSRRRELKHRLATAETAGDEAEVKRVQEKLREVERSAAADRRREATDDSDVAPVSRTSGPAKVTTAASSGSTKSASK